jgi:transcriptional regulator with XRE-family HTH domain
MLEFKTISRIARVLMDMRQKDLAEALGMELESISCWERGLTSPSARHRKAFEALCVKRGVGFTATGMPVLIGQSMRVPEPDDCKRVA